MARRTWGALLACALVWAGGAAAQAPGAPWNAVPGNAADLSIAPSGEVYAAGRRGELWRWRDENSSWTPIPGSALRIAAAPGGLLWGVLADGTLQRYDGARWTALPVKARDVAVDSQGNAVIARDDGSLARWNPVRMDWDPVPGSGQRVAVHADGSIWSVAEDGTIARHDAQKSEPLPGRARDIAVGGDTVIIAGEDGRLQRWNAGARSWDAEPGGPADVAIIALSPRGVPWAANSQGAILTQAPIKTLLAGSLATPDTQPGGVGFGKRGQRAGGGSPGAAGTRSRAAAAASAAATIVLLKPPAQITDPDPFEFVDTRGSAARVAIGQDGSVFAIALDGSLARWSNSRSSFVAFPGSLVRIAVDPAGLPWGINQAGRIFRHTGTDWRQVRGTASDLAIAANGSVMIASSSGVLGRFDPPSEGFLPLPGELFFLALAPDGSPWGLLKDGTVMRCAAIPCEQVGRGARNISIGPDGSVFIVNFSNQLQRFNAGTAAFEIIPVPGHVPASVAVGPSGRPWVVTSTGKVLSSRFFERDESVDLQMAAATITPTTGSGDVAALLGTTTQGGSGFSFSKNLQFTAITPPCAVLDDVAVGVDGSVLALCDNGFRLLRYDTGSKSFIELNGLPTSAIGAADTDADGRVWIADRLNNGRIYRQRQKNGGIYDQIQAPVATGGGFARDIAIGPDGSVYYIDGTGTLYRKTASQSNFSKLLSGTYFKVAIGVANDVWLRTSTQLFQLVAGQLEKRPPTGTPVTSDVGGGADGSIYAIQTYPTDSVETLYRWNANNRSFDRVNRAADHVDVAPNGRPWVTNTSQSGDVSFAR